MTRSDLPIAGVDIVADLNMPLDLLPDNCAERIFSSHTLEHIREFMSLMREIHRLSSPGGVVEIVVPHFSNVYAFSDPTHVRFFGLYSMYYFVAPEDQPSIRQVPAFYTDVRFKIKSIRVEFDQNDLLDRLIAPILSRFVNRGIVWQDFFERRLSGVFYASQLRYVLEPVK